MRQQARTVVIVFSVGVGAIQPRITYLAGKLIDPGEDSTFYPLHDNSTFLPCDYRVDSIQVNPRPGLLFCLLVVRYILLGNKDAAREIRSRYILNQQ